MILTILTLAILVTTFFIQYQRYALKLLLHPSAYFILMWILSVISFILFNIAGLDIIYYEDHLIELNIFISFTCISFIFWGKKDSKIVKKNHVKLSLDIPYDIVSIFAYLILISSLIAFYTQGFDVAKNREIVNQNLIDAIGTRKSLLELIIGLFSMLKLPISIYSGWIIGYNFVRGIKRVKYIYYIPLVAVIIDTIAGGGRSTIIYSFLIYIIGFGLGFFTMPTQFDYKRAFRPIIKYVLLYFLLFSMYSSYVSSQRSILQSGRDQTSTVSTLLRAFPLLSPLSGTLEYLVFHWQGYQWRRNENFSSNREYGQTTFAFITHFNVPVFSQLLGTNVSLQNAFDLKYLDSVRGTEEARERGIIGNSITSTVYMVLVRDFGFFGTLFITFLFVGLTQYFFRRLFDRNNVGFWSIILFIAVYVLWTQTFFTHHLAGPWLNGFIYPLLILEFLKRFHRSSMVRTNFQMIKNV